MMNKTILSTAVVAVLGTSALTVSTSAVAVIDGQYELIINTTPTATRSTFYGGTETFFLIGTQTRGFNTSFTFGTTPNPNSQGATDNANTVTVTTDFTSYYGVDGTPGNLGTGVVDGNAGRIVFDVVGGVIQNAQSFSVDTIAGTAGGNFAQFMTAAGLGGIGGTINDTTGAMTLSLGGRYGAIDGPAGGVIGPWNIDPSGALLPFTTGSVGTAGTITGTACSGSAGAYSCILVSGGAVGNAWGTFAGNPYYEVWNIGLNRIGDAAPGEIPVPAAVWLFGSGLMGLVGVARRRKA